MNRNKTAKAGASFKVLALIASLSMILAGFAAGLMASPASAGEKKHSEYSHSDREHDETKCENDGGHWVPGDGGSSSSADPDSVDVQTPKPAHCDDSEQEECENPQLASGSDHEWVKDGDDWNCEPKDPPVCDDAALATETEDDCDDPCDAIVLSSDDNDDCNDPCDDVVLGSVNENENENEDGCEGEPTGTVSLNCAGDWTASAAVSGDDTVEVRVQIDGETVVEDEFEGTWSDNGSEASLGAGPEHTIVVQIRHGRGKWKTVADETIECGAEPTASVTLTCSNGWTASLSGYEPETKVRVQLDGENVAQGWVDGEGEYSDLGSTALADGSHTLTIQTGTYDDEEEEYTWVTEKSVDTVCTTPTPPCTENCTPVVHEQPPVSTPVVVAAATVEAPVAVAAPAPATVAAPAPATVAVPAAATLPAAVPAGDGSQAPGMPMWALAMIAVGLLGAGFAGKSILAARK